MINGENANINMSIKVRENNINAYRIFKRAVDILASIIGIIILCPLIVIVFIANKISRDDGPIFFM